MAKYKLIYQSETVRREDGVFIASGDKNPSWLEYQQWLIDGNTPDPADEPTPEELTRRDEITQAAPTARQWMIDHPQIVNGLLRLTPAEQEAQVDVVFSNLSASQRAIITALVVGLSALAKERYL